MGLINQPIRCTMLLFQSVVHIKTIRIFFFFYLLFVFCLGSLVFVVKPQLSSSQSHLESFMVATRWQHWMAAAHNYGASFADLVDCSFVLPLQSVFFSWDILASLQDCGLELNDEDGHRCYPLEDHLFCHSCHVKRLEKGPSPAAVHQHHF